jgi:hypothetical protein
MNSTEKVSAARTVPGAAFAQSAPRPTPVPQVRFGQVLQRTLAATAQAALSVVPGAPLAAFALRSAAGPVAGPTMSMAPGLGMGPGLAGGLGAPMGRGVSSAEGPGAVAGGAGAAGGAGGIESSLQQSQEMSLYYLQIQETVNAQNRSFTALSNVLKAEHETVKTAIGNIR